jgi:hypothetical protein
LGAHPAEHGPAGIVDRRAERLATAVGDQRTEVRIERTFDSRAMGARELEQA